MSKRKIKGKYIEDDRLPLRNYFQLQNKSLGCIGQFSIRFLGQQEKHETPSLLVKLSGDTWAIFTNISDAFSKAASQKNKFGLHVEEAIFRHTYNSSAENEAYSMANKDQEMREMKEFRYYIMRDMPSSTNTQHIKNGDHVFV